MSPEAIATIVCRETGWTYDEYEQQPAWLIDYLVSMMNEEARSSNRKNKG